MHALETCTSLKHARRAYVNLSRACRCVHLTQIRRFERLNGVVGLYKTPAINFRARCPLPWRAAHCSSLFVKRPRCQVVLFRLHPGAGHHSLWETSKQALRGTFHGVQ
jgi:hypothetical protein